MKTYLYILVLMSLLRCKKNDVVDIPEPQQTLFDNIPACCSGDCLKQELWQIAYKDIFEIKNILGTIEITNAGGYIIPDTSSIKVVVDTARFPDWSSETRKTFGCCNLPEKLKNLSKKINIRFDCRLLYQPPSRIGSTVIDRSGSYGIELIKLEILP